MKSGLFKIQAQERIVFGTPAGEAALAAAMGKPGLPAWQAIRELIQGLGLPSTLRDVGIARENLDELARRALDYQPVLLNPRRIETTADVMQILEIAF